MWGRYFPRGPNGVTSDNSLTLGLDEFKLLNRNAYYIIGKVSSGTFLQGESPVYGTIGSDIVFNAFIADGRTNKPFDLSIYDSFDVLFCGKSDQAIAVPQSNDSAEAVGFITIFIPAEQSKDLDINNSDFDLRMYRNGVVEDLSLIHI